MDRVMEPTIQIDTPSQSRNLENDTLSAARPRTEKLESFPLWTCYKSLSVLSTCRKVYNRNARDEAGERPVRLGNRNRDLSV